MSSVPDQVANRLRLLLLAAACWLCFVPTAHALRPPIPAESQLKEESALPEPSAGYVVCVVEADGRIGLFVGNNPIGFVDPFGLEITYHYGGAILEPSGSVPYLSGESFLEQLIAGTYNVIPIVNNTLGKFGEAYNNTTHAFGEFVTAITGDPNVGDGVRNAANVLPFILPCSSGASAAKTTRFSSGAGSGLGGGSQALLNDAVFGDAALRNVRLGTYPVYDASLPVFGEFTASGLNNFGVKIGPQAFANRAELIGTIVHEETHLRFFQRLNAGGARTGAIDALGMEESYVRAVETRFLRMKGLNQ